MFICWEVTNLQVQQADLFSSYIMAFKLSRTVHIRSGYMLSSIFLCLALRNSYTTSCYVCITALACNCSGRVLFVLIRRLFGAVVFLYNMYAFSVDCVKQRGPVYSLRLSADPTAHPCSRKWNPQRDTVFAVATSMACFHSFEALYF
ncbi:unnamed protein product [Brugia pahangi]|uniref:Secreted protein n=1 Tax=Brugia pahangi TaxID=6280 RepID=A0A0N4TZJ9_BRUPA|nr:unnamed protein product [Brugia pahangi]